MAPTSWEADVGPRYPIRASRSACCARAAIGQAAAPPTKETNSRRFIRPPLRQSSRQGLLSRASDRKDSIPQQGRETAALRIFRPAHVADGSKAAALVLL